MSRLVIHSAGPGVTLQDGGRHGYLRFGVTAAGPMDPLAHATANLALGNERDATAIEISLGGVELSCEKAALDIALAGGDFTIILDGKRLPRAFRLTLRPGERLKIAAGEAGAWCYLAIAGEFDVPEVLGSQATHARSGFGGVKGRGLMAGDQIGIAAARSFSVAEGALVAPWLDRPSTVIRILPGPQQDYFAPDQYQALLEGPWEVSSRGDRMAIFLDGPRLKHAEGYNTVSDGVAMGAIQVPGEGLPIVLMADRQPTGGYPKIATVIGADLGRLAQLRGGTKLTFASIAYEEALEARRAEDACLSGGIEVEPFLRQEFSLEFLAGCNLVDGLVSGGKARSITDDELHESGRLTARERLSLLFDPHSMTNSSEGAVIAGEGSVFGRPVLAFAKDTMIAVGAIGPAEAAFLVALRRRARSQAVPLIGFYDGTALDSDHGLDALSAFAGLSESAARRSNPEIAMVFGSAIGADAILAALADLVFAVEGEGCLMLAGTDLTRQVTNEITPIEDLGAANFLVSGRFANEVEAVNAIRRLIDFLPEESENASRDPAGRQTPALNQLVPLETAQPYDMHELLRAVADHGEVFELRGHVAGNLITALSRVGGRTCGVIANQPLTKGGVLDAPAMRKAAQFISLCNRWNVPLVRFVDTPGMLPGLAEEHSGSIEAAANMFAADLEGAAPRVTVITRHALGPAAAAMGVRQGDNTICLFWPTAIHALARDAAERGAATTGCEVIEPSLSRANIIAALQQLTERS
ncbi:5-oxoprolinase/urea amidolyase family protein [Chelativorans xinjiangense]|uniref:5-oxoprolinase/urea amidolyase family protein n=1 Tax=Chelativorans xinjiangense TaxID=2681485 RepID=UPI001357BC58